MRHLKRLAWKLQNAARDLLMLPPSMTYDQFLAVLRETPRTWRVTPEGWIRSGESDCPLTEGCKYLTGQQYPVREWESAVKAMHLPKPLARMIWPAADNAEGHDPKVRRDLLAATGLLTDPLDAELAALVASGQPQTMETEEHEFLQV